MFKSGILTTIFHLETILLYIFGALFKLDITLPVVISNKHIIYECKGNLV